MSTGSAAAYIAEIVIESTADNDDADDREHTQGSSSPKELTKPPDDGQDTDAEPRHRLSDPGKAIVPRFGHTNAHAGDLGFHPWPARR